MCGGMAGRLQGKGEKVFLDSDGWRFLRRLFVSLLLLFFPLFPHFCVVSPASFDNREAGRARHDGEFVI